MGCCDGTTIFSTPAGKVIAVDGNAVPIAFAVDGDDELFNDLKGIVTSIGLQAQGGFQFMHALREFIYVYVFTERIGEFVINGLAFPDTCNLGVGPQGPQGSQGVHGTTGMERVTTWYEANRITTRASPITIAIGATVSYEAFLVSMKLDIANPDTGIAQFALRFNFVPNISDQDDFCFPIDEADDCLDSPCGPQGEMLGDFEEDDDD